MKKTKDCAFSCIILVLYADPRRLNNCPEAHTTQTIHHTGSRRGANERNPCSGIQLQFCRLGTLRGGILKCLLSPEDCSGSPTLTVPKESGHRPWSTTPPSPTAWIPAHDPPRPLLVSSSLAAWERMHKKKEGVLPSFLALICSFWLYLLNTASRASRLCKGQWDLLHPLHFLLLFLALLATPLPGPKQFSLRCPSRLGAVGGYFCFRSWHPSAETDPLLLLPFPPQGDAKPMASWSLVPWTSATFLRMTIPLTSSPPHVELERNNPDGRERT